MSRKLLPTLLRNFPCFFLALLLVAGCAGPQPRQPVRIEPPPEISPPPPKLDTRAEPKPQETPVRPAPGGIPKERIFPEFVALIAQPGDTFSSLAAKYLHDPGLAWYIAEFNGVDSLLPGQEVIIPLKPHTRGGLSFRGYQTVPVISYHKFSKIKSDRTTVLMDDFEKQMQYLKENEIRVLTMDEFFDFLDFKRSIPKKSVVITIDDDWRSARDIAYPILKKYGYPATLFLYTDSVSENSWNILQEMSRNGLDIQCHTKTHRRLDRKNGSESFQEYFEWLKREMAVSAELISRRMNKRVKYLAYPYGDTNPLVIAVARKLGYRGAFTAKRGANPSLSHHYQINRSMIYGHFGLKDFERNLVYFIDQELD